MKRGELATCRVRRPVPCRRRKKEKVAVSPTSSRRKLLGVIWRDASASDDVEDFHVRPAAAAHGVAAPGASERGGVPEGEGQDPRGGAKVRVALPACVQCQTKSQKASKSKKGEEVTRTEGPQNARLFAIGIILELILVHQK